MPFKALTIDLVCSILKERHVIDDATLNVIKVREDEQRLRLKRKSGTNGQSQVTPVDVITSMELTAPGKSGTVISEEVIMKALAAYWKLPYFKIDFKKMKPCVDISKLSEPFARKHLIVPVSTSESMLFVAMINPMDVEALEAMRSLTKLQVRPVISTKHTILKAIAHCYGATKSADTSEQHLNALDVSLSAAEKEVGVTEDAALRTLEEEQYDDKHIVNVVNLVLNYAFEQRTSEIHIEPKRHRSVIRFRIDGILFDVKHVPLAIHNNMIQRLKVLAGMKISERRKPQDGRTQFKFHDREIYLRISSMPVAFGEKLVLRLFDPITLFRHIDDLGFSDDEIQQYLSFITRSSGIILITGPAGCGKTTTLYSTLNQLSERGINITTIEDPIESVHEAFNQVSINPDAGVTFEVAMRHLARQSPDVIMIGEIRDKESMEHTMQEALSGRLIITSLHTHDAPSAIVRLVNTGTQPLLVESTVIAVVAQRLIRRVCDHCAEPSVLTEEEVLALGLSERHLEKANLRKGEGCSVCRGTGYHGQTAIFEIMEISDQLGALIRKGAGAQALRNAARKQGMRTLKDKAIEKMLEGSTTPDEVLRLTGGLTRSVPHKFKSRIILTDKEG